MHRKSIKKDHNDVSLITIALLFGTFFLLQIASTYVAWVVSAYLQQPIYEWAIALNCISALLLCVLIYTLAFSGTIGCLEAICGKQHMGKQQLSASLLSALKSLPAALLFTAGGYYIALLVQSFMGKTQYEQVIIYYLDHFANHKSLMMMLSVHVIFTAPCLEEFLFRGAIHTVLRRFFSIKGRIIVSSFAFTLAHLSFAQGWSNLSMCIALLIYSVFLGWEYEKHRSLIGPVLMHTTFNMVNLGLWFIEKNLK